MFHFVRQTLESLYLNLDPLDIDSIREAAKKFFFYVSAIKGGGGGGGGGGR